MIASLQTGSAWLDSPSVDVSIASFNTAPLTRVCLQSVIDNASECVASLWVVDNASSDSSVSLVTTSFPSAHLIANVTNVGFGRAHNQSFESTYSRYFLVLNSDAELTPRSLQRLVHCLETRPDVAIVGPRLIYPDGLRQASPTPLPTLTMVLVRFLGLKHLVRGRRLRQWIHDALGVVVGETLTAHLNPYSSREPESGPAEFLSGACMLIRRAAIRNEQLFDGRFFMYLEDADLCKRMLDKGWRVWYESTSTVVHQSGASSPPNYRRSEESLLSSVYYFKKHHSLTIARIVLLVIRVSITGELLLLAGEWLLRPHARVATAARIAERLRVARSIGLSPHYGPVVVGTV